MMMRGGAVRLQQLKTSWHRIRGISLLERLPRFEPLVAPTVEVDSEG
jgi:hypothetical protein